MDGVYFTEEALRFEQLEEAEISDLEGAFVQVQHRSLLGLSSAVSSHCPVHAGGAQRLSGRTQCPGEEQGLGWTLGMLPTEMSPSLNVSGAVHQGVLLPKNAGTEQPAERLMDSQGISSCKVCSFSDTAGIFLLKMAFFFLV